MNTGAPDEGRDDAAWSSPGRATTRPSDVGDEQEHRPEHQRSTASTQRWSVPAIARATCGTVSPTKAIGPTAAVAAPPSSVMATAPASACARRAAPSARAGVVAERERVERPGEHERDQDAHGDEGQHHRRPRRVPRPASEPTDHWS